MRYIAKLHHFAFSLSQMLSDSLATPAGEALSNISNHSLVAGEGFTYKSAILSPYPFIHIYASASIFVLGTALAAPL